MTMYEVGYSLSETVYYVIFLVILSNLILYLS